MQRFLALVVVLSISPWSLAESIRTVPPDILAGIVDDHPNPLPKHETAEEMRLPLPSVTREEFLTRSPPTGAVRCPAEYEPSEGLLVSWKAYTAVLTELIVGLTTGDPDAIAYVVVGSASDQSSATSTLTSAGADMTQVEFILYNTPEGTDSVWMRDYGPRFIFEDGQRAMVDHTYNRNREDDNAFPNFLSPHWNEPHYDIPLTHGGGNFHLFSNGDAFMTELILDENPSLTEQDVKDLYTDYQNVDLTIYPPLPTSFDGTQHIDMWMLPVGDDKVIIGQYEVSTGQPYTVTENAVTNLTSRGYTVYRTPGWNSGGTHYTYTNAVILNDLAFISQFGGSYTAEDTQAKSVFETAMPDHTIVQVDCSGIINAAGAIHCIVMQVPAYPRGLRVTPGAGLDTAGPAGGPFTPASIVYTLENTTDDPIDYNVTKTHPWVSTTNGTGTLPADGTTTVTVSINAAANTLGNGVYDDTVSFINTTDGSGNTTRGVRLAVGAPELVYDFNMDADPGWVCDVGWEWGQPTGEGGEHGSPDPTSAHTGDSVYGYNLVGDYENDIPKARNLRSDSLDCTDLSRVTVSFWRWLGVEQPTYDHAYFRVSNDGSQWSTIWQNTAEVADGTWVYQEFDITDVADDQPTVYLQWTMGTTDDSWRFCGWNIDDVQIWAIRPSATDPCDVDGDGDIDPDDAGAFVACLTGPNGAIPAECEAADFDDDAQDVDLADFQLYTAACNASR